MALNHNCHYFILQVIQGGGGGSMRSRPGTAGLGLGSRGGGGAIGSDLMSEGGAGAGGYADEAKRDADVDNLKRRDPWRIQPSQGNP